MTNTTDIGRDAYLRLGRLQDLLGLTDAQLEVLTDPSWRDQYPYLTIVEILADIRFRTASDIDAYVFEAIRRDGATWTEVGNALGTSRQAAQQKYGR